MVRSHFWQHAWTGWHLATATVLGLLGLLVWLDGEHPVWGRVLAVGAIGLIGIWYWYAGTTALHRTRIREGLRYAAGVIPLFGLTLLLHPAAPWLLVVLVPHLFAMLRHFAVATAATCLLFTVLAGAILWHDGVSQASLTAVVMFAVLPLAFSVLLGGWVTGVIRQSLQRAALIDEMERTRGELAASRYEAGVRAERERLSAEIHDTLTQGFASVVLLTQAAKANLARNPEAARAQLDAIEQTSRENLAEARSLVFALAPADLSGGNLADAVRRVADRHTRDTGVTVEVAVTGTPDRHPPQVDVVVLRACQEALHNVRKHASASSARIDLEFGSHTVVLTVSDDGTGLDPSALDGPGHGLRSLRQRVESCSGTMTISSDGVGTTLRVEMPQEPR